MPATTPTPFKTIVTCVTETPAYGDVLPRAARLAELNEAHLSVLCLGIDRTNPGAYYAGAQAIALQSNLQLAHDEAAQAEAAVTAAMQGSPVPWDAQAIMTQIGALALSNRRADPIRRSRRSAETLWRRARGGGTR